MIRYNRSWSLLLILLLAAPAGAQEEMPVEDPAAAEIPAEAAPDESIPADEPAPVEGDAAAADEAPIETVPVEEAATADASLETIPVEGEGEAQEEEGEPWRLYAGLDLVGTTVGTDSGDVDSGMYRLRFGRRVFDQIAVEAHFGVDNADDDEAPTDGYYGLYVVPMALALETVELAFPLGYAKTEIGNSSLSSIAYGFVAELPLRGFGEEMPDLRFGLGWMVYHQSSEARVYGANFGVRYDFTTASLGNPFGWVGDLDLWPFGGDDAAEGDGAAETAE